MSREPRKTAGGVIIKVGKILLGKRRKGRLYPDIWDIFGGHIEEGEEPEATVHREIIEELSIEPLDMEYLETYEDKDPVYGIPYIHHIFIVRCWDGKPVNNNPYEHEEIGWFSREEIEGLKMHEEVRRIILEDVDF